MCCSGHDVVRSTEITATSPAGSGTVDITVISPGGTSAKFSADQFSYTSYTPVTPARICDTRAVHPGVVANQCNTGGNTTLGSMGVLNISMAGYVPPGASSPIVSTNALSVVVNVTAVNTTQAGGFLTVWPTGSTMPNSSNLNFGAGESIPNLVQVSVGSRGDIYNYNGSTDELVDVEGYSAPASTTTGEFVPLSPVRICDTRPPGSGVTSNQCDTGSNTTLSGGKTIQVQVSSISGIPSSATAVVLNVTAVNTTANGGFVTVYPAVSSIGSPPNISDLNRSQGETRANLVIVKVGVNNSVDVYNAAGSADLLVDIKGYYG